MPKRVELILALLVAAATSVEAGAADLVLKNGNIHTVSDQQPHAEAIAAKDGKIIFVGSNAGVAEHEAGARVIDLGGQTVVPGLTDAHCHLSGVGEREMTLNLEGTSSLEDFLAKVKVRVDRAKAGDWITGRGWIETFWPSPAFPTRGDLDRIAPHNPVYLTRADGHGAVANSAAIRLARVGKETPNPFGGEVRRDQTGEPNGLFLDNAQDLITQHIPGHKPEEDEHAILLGVERSLKLGWTEVHIAGNSFREVELIQRLYNEGKIKLRIYNAVRGPSPDTRRLLTEVLTLDAFEHRFANRGIKVSFDGALGSKGAALFENYSDDDTAGFLKWKEDDLMPMFEEALRKGVQVWTHAIGDRANREILNLYEKAFRRVPPGERKIKEPRWRVEHAQIVHASDIPRFAKLGVIPSMQPSHAISDLHFAGSRLGLKRLEGAYAWNSFIKAGSIIPGGSDAPVERGEPMIEFYAAVARKDLKGFSSQGWHPEQAVSREQALKMFTIWAAFAAFEENSRGSIESGKLADLTVLSQDIMKVPETEILKTKCVMTVVNGEVVYEAGKSTAVTSVTNPFPVSIRVDAAKALGELKPIWRFFGGDEPNYATMKDGQKLLSELGQLRPKEVYFRTHNLLNTGDGTPALKWGSTDAYKEDAAGNPVYNWTIVDRIFDTYLDRGVRPYAQVGFMPQALSSRPEPYRHEWRPGLPYERVYTGWAYPPKDYAKWGELTYQWVKHCVERYGLAEVESWYWETWNEANIGYWRGTPQEFQKLHDYAIDAVRRALPSARVGGPDAAGSGGAWTRNFLEHCLRGTNYATGQVGTPIDFVSFHAKGAPVYTNGHVRMGIANQLRTIDEGFRIVASYPELKNTPIVIGESDPEGCAACQGPSFSYRNGTVYSSYTAASFARKHDLAARHAVNFTGALTWAFTFEDQSYFAGFRQLASCGLALPVLNVFRMFSQMTGQRLTVTSDGAVPLEAIVRRGVRERPDVAALASLDPHQLWILVWHYHDDDVIGPDAAVELAVAGLPSALGDAKLTHYRVDENHSNAYGAWKRLGSPIAPNQREYTLLQNASRLAALAEAPATVRVQQGGVTLKFALPRQGVSLLHLKW